MSTKIFVVGRSLDYANWIEGNLVHKMKDADVVVLTGGEDVHPSLYGEKKGKHTYSNYGRDMYEQQEFEKAIQMDIPVIGICRGSQLACVLSGGRLVQHQENPDNIHFMETIEGKQITISSLHHQAQYPYELSEDSYKLLAWTNDISRVHLNGENVEISDKKFPEAEVVYYPKTRALGIQGHPEMMWFNRKKYTETFDWLNEKVEKLLNNSL